MSSDLNHLYNLAASRLGSSRRAVVLDRAAGVACAVAGYAWLVAPGWRFAIAIVVAIGAGAMIFVSSARARGAEKA